MLDLCTWLEPLPLMPKLSLPEPDYVLNLRYLEIDLSTKTNDQLIGHTSKSSGFTLFSTLFLKEIESCFEKAYPLPALKGIIT